MQQRLVIRSILVRDIGGWGVLQPQNCMGSSAYVHNVYTSTCTCTYIHALADFVP